MRIIKATCFLLTLVIFSSCAAIGTKTIYKTNESYQIHKVGFNKLDGDDALNNIFPLTAEIYNDVVFKTFQEYGINDTKKLDMEISFDEPDLNKITQVCRDQKLDALLLTTLKFIHVTYSLYFVPVAQNYDTEVQMKLFDKNGRLLVSTLHNTLNGNSYMMPPPADRTVQDGTKGALKRMTKEMGLVRDK